MPVMNTTTWFGSRSRSVRAMRNLVIGDFSAFDAEPQVYERSSEALKLSGAARISERCEVCGANLLPGRGASHIHIPHPSTCPDWLLPGKLNILCDPRPAVQQVAVSSSLGAAHRLSRGIWSRMRHCRQPLLWIADTLLT
jgi:hypothetical protein